MSNLVDWVVKNKKGIILNILTLGIYGLIKLSDRWAPIAKIGEKPMEKSKEINVVAPRKEEEKQGAHTGLTILFFTISGLILIFTEFPLGRGPGYAFGNLVAVLLGYSLIPGLISFIISRAAKKNFWFILSIFFLMQAAFHLIVGVYEAIVYKNINQMLFEDLYK